MNIYQRMSAITEELRAVAKNLEVGEGKSKYKATGEADVLAAVKPLEAKHGVYSYPVERQITREDVITTEKEYKDKTYVTKRLFMRIWTKYRFVNMEDPTDFMEVVSFGDGLDVGDKSPGKAMTYADKYALMKAYKIITGDDPDQIHSDDIFKDTVTTTDEPKNEAVYLSDYQKKIINDYPAKTKDWIKKTYGIGSIDLLTKEQASAIIKTMKKKQEQQEKAYEAELAAEAQQAFEGV